TISGGAGELLFTRSAYANACNMQLMQDIISAIDWFNKQENLKVIRVSGAGKAFCAGYDLNEFTNSSPDLIRKSAELGLQMNHALTSVKAITVAAIHGACVGGGMVLAAACDLRYAADDTVFFLLELTLG